MGNYENSRCTLTLLVISQLNSCCKLSSISSFVSLPCDDVRPFLSSVFSPNGRLDVTNLYRKLDAGGRVLKKKMIISVEERAIY